MDFFSQTEVEFDLAHGVIRLLVAKDCADAQMVYWNQPYSEARYTVGRLGDSSSAGFGDTAFYTVAKLNGHALDVQIDSGASATVIDGDLARRLGARTDPGAASSAGGIGPGEIQVHTAVFDTFSLGDESIRNVRLQTAKLFSNLRIAETGTRLGYDATAIDEPRMLLGLDFLSAHRVLLSPKHQLMYFSYEGGPVFQVQTPAKRVGGEAGATPPVDRQPAAAPPVAVPH